mgnify:CR=1 FL=1
MNQLINQRFDLIESFLIESPAVVSYEIVQRVVAPTDGKLRIRINLGKNNFAEFFEYASTERKTIKIYRYSYHWQDALGRLKSRWDNAPHYPQLPHAPHHRHLNDETVTPVSMQPDIFDILKEIELALI